MGLLSTLAFLAAPFLLRREPEQTPDHRIAELKARIGELESDCERWRKLADSWRERYERAIAPIVDRELVAMGVADRQIRQLMQAQAQQMQAAMNAQMAMNAQNFASQALYEQSRLGQAQQNQWHHCTCVPGRADALLRGD
jgi:phytoene dehydrogenase-like protein